MGHNETIHILAILHAQIHLHPGRIFRLDIIPQRCFLMSVTLFLWTSIHQERPAVCVGAQMLVSWIKAIFAHLTSLTRNNEQMTCSIISGAWNPKAVQQTREPLLQSTCLGLSLNNFPSEVVLSWTRVYILENGREP
jgi:hypothetical protein